MDAQPDQPQDPSPDPMRQWLPQLIDVLPERLLRALYTVASWWTRPPAGA